MVLTTKMIKINIIWILAILIMVAFLAIGIWLQKPKESQQTKTPETSEKFPSYTSDDGSFSFLYPNNLIVKEGDEIVLEDPSGNGNVVKIYVKVINKDLTNELEFISVYLDNQIFEIEGTDRPIAIQGPAYPIEYKYPGYDKSYSLQEIDHEHPYLGGRGFFTKFPDKDEYLFIDVLAKTWSGGNELFDPIFNSLTFLDEGKAVEALPSVMLNNCYSLNRDNDIGSAMIAEPKIAGLFKFLPADWTYTTACLVDNFRNIMTVIVTRSGEADPSIKQVALANTKKYLPATYNNYITDELEYYSFYLYPTWLTKLEIGDQSRLFEKNTLYPIVDLAWGSALSACWISSADWRDGIVTLSCGGGDNGCFSDEQISYSILSRTITNIGTCSKNCDLAENEPATFSCSM